MGVCVSTPLPPDVFNVRYINDDKKLIQKGTMEVGETELVFTDDRTHEKWQWPLKYLRRYQFEQNVFSFEAGRKCHGGAGVYAFSTNQASHLFNKVAVNINENFKQPGEQPLFPSEVLVSQPDRNAVSFTQSLCCHTYENIDVPKPMPVPVLNYSKAVFAKLPDEYPLPHVDIQLTQYSKINFDTQKAKLKTLSPISLQYTQLYFPSATSQSEEGSSVEATRTETRATVTQNLPSLPKVFDKVNYGVLNFEAMNAITELHKQREQENLAKEREMQEREREREREKKGKDYRTRKEQK